MILGVIVLAAVGLLLSVLGWLLWKKEKISLLHDYHYDKVSEADKKAFCTLSGAGLVILGLGLLVTAVIFGITESLWSFLGVGTGFAVGLGLLIHAGKKYNSGK